MSEDAHEIPERETFRPPMGEAPPAEPAPPSVKQALLWLVARTAALEFVEGALKAGNLEAARVSAELGLKAGPDIATICRWATGRPPEEVIAEAVEQGRTAAAAVRKVFGMPVVVSEHVPAGKILIPTPEQFEAALAAVHRKAPMPPADFPCGMHTGLCRACAGLGSWQEAVFAGTGHVYCLTCRGTGQELPGVGFTLLPKGERTLPGDEYLQAGRLGHWQRIRTILRCEQALGYLYRRPVKDRGAR